jgi:mono/diheme cytochrome c family protein
MNLLVNIFPDVPPSHLLLTKKGTACKLPVILNEKIFYWEKRMKKIFNAILSFVFLLSFSSVIGCKKEDKTAETATPVAAQGTEENNGEKLFHQHCIMCHHEGSHIKDNKNIRNEDDIVTAMRKPKSAMPKFDENEIREDDAKKIAKYIFFSIIFGK